LAQAGQHAASPTRARCPFGMSSAGAGSVCRSSSQGDFFQRATSSSSSVAAAAAAAALPAAGAPSRAAAAAARPRSTSTRPRDRQQELPEPPRAGLDNERPRGKRSGYEQRFASAGDIIRMEAQPVRRHRSRRPDPSMCSAAGRSSLETADHNVNGPRPRPMSPTDPVTHQVHDGQKLTAGRDSVIEGMEGAAGVTSKRLRYLETDIVTQGEFCERPGLNRIGDGASQVLLEAQRNIKHGGQTSANLSRASRGVRIFQDVTTLCSGVSTMHAASAQSANEFRHEVPEETLALWGKQRGHFMDGDGQYIVNIAGHEDLLPAGTKPCLSCDRPPTAAYSAMNAKRQLAHLERVAHCESDKDAPFVGGAQVNSDEFLCCMRRDHIDQRLHPGLARQASADARVDYAPSCTLMQGRQQDCLKKDNKDTAKKRHCPQGSETLNRSSSSRAAPELVMRNSSGRQTTPPRTTASNPRQSRRNVTPPRSVASQQVNREHSDSSLLGRNGQGQSGVGTPRAQPLERPRSGMSTFNNLDELNGARGPSRDESPCNSLRCGASACDATTPPDVARPLRQQTCSSRPGLGKVSSVPAYGQRAAPSGSSRSSCYRARTPPGTLSSRSKPRVVQMPEPFWSSPPGTPVTGSPASVGTPISCAA